MDSSASGYYLHCDVCNAPVVGQFGLQQHKESSKRCLSYQYYQKGYDWNAAQSRVTESGSKGKKSGNNLIKVLRGLDRNCGPPRGTAPGTRLTAAVAARPRSWTQKQQGQIPQSNRHRAGTRRLLPVAGTRTPARPEKTQC